jgi:hypothetical protein
MIGDFRRSPAYEKGIDSSAILPFFSKKGGCMDVIDALVSHHAVLRQLYQQSETNPDTFGEFIHHLVVHRASQPLPQRRI